ncbi:unnamed protein product [Symbiodinium pilosum]|uniref:Uncharacterized protein n=1 Tax=Symbiodinium pilosum TaxID=2952 RepID=A0A812U3C4_SYMPI|nr:unnamed protein product [Symbiodinium pilosum]
MADPAGVDNTSADDLLMQMVGKAKVGEGDAAAPPEPAKGDDNENKENKEGSENKAETDGKGPTPALPAPKVATMVIESDSDTEKGKAPPAAAPPAPPPAAPPAAPAAPPAAAAPTQEKPKKDKKDKKKKAKSSSSSDSDSDSDAPKKKKRINNFSSLRNIEKERAEVRKNRNAGADAAKAMLKALSDNPYFAP